MTMTNVPAGAAIHRTSVMGRLSRRINRLLGGTPNQTLCARIAAYNPDCHFCRLMARLIEPDHCRIELARWERRGTSAAVRLGEWRASEGYTGKGVHHEPNT
jgi:hypothetical protein